MLGKEKGREVKGWKGGCWIIAGADAGIEKCACVHGWDPYLFFFVRADLVIRWR